MESLPQAVLQAGAIVVKSVVNNDRQCFYNKNILENWIERKNYDDPMGESWIITYEPVSKFLTKLPRLY